MNISKKIKTLALCIGVLLVSLPSYAHGDMKSQIEQKMSWGEVPQLLYICNEGGVTLELLADPIKHTKEEAGKILGEFFKNHPAESCKIQSQGKYANDTRYFTGSYTTKEGAVYEAYFEAALDQDDGHYHISLIRIEK